MGLLDNQPSSSVRNVADEGFHKFAMAGSGVALVPEAVQQEGPAALKADAGDFRKWMANLHPGTKVSFPEDSPKVLLQSGDIWLPLMYLANDLSVQVFLGMVSNFFYDRTKGLLKGDQPQLHLALVYEEQGDRTTKRLEFTGRAEDLSKVMRKFDANNFFDESA